MTQHQRVAPESVDPEEALLSVDSLDVEFASDSGPIQALRDVSVTLEKGQTLGIAGESGSGKSTLALAIVRYLAGNARIPNGRIRFKGRDLLELNRRELRNIRGNQIAHVAQNAALSLNPSMKVGPQIKEGVVLHQGLSGEAAKEEVYNVLEQVNIPDPQGMADRYPNELSGGQQQRVLIATGLACDPELLILDEPTTGLDVTTQSKLLDLISHLTDSYDVGIILISHNLSAIAQTADQVNILYAGEMMEKGPVDEVFTNPANPYTQALLATTPEMDTNKDLRAIPGQIPNLDDVPSGCIFADRCAFVEDECRDGPIAMESLNGGHMTRCRNWETALDDPISAGSAEKRLSSGGDVILEAEGLVKEYDQGSYLQQLIGDHEPVRAVRGVDLQIREGEAVGLVGESGCGKSTIAELLLTIEDLTEGTIRYRGNDIESLNQADEREFRSEVGIIFQDPERSLNPRIRVKSIIERPLKLFTDLDEQAREERIDELLDQMSCSQGLKTKYPHELSGGQQQRIAIARAFAKRPSLVVLDEPVSSLDVSVQASILELLDQLRDEYNTSYLMISHDMGVIESLCDRLSVMYLGKIVEEGALSDVLNPPHHPYTRALLSSIPELDPHAEDSRIRLEGDVPSARDPPSGCSFHTRCPQKIGRECETDSPTLEPVEGATQGTSEHCLSCHLSERELSESVVE